ncbi:hypothetical protein EOD41_06360 [Mucilaginibacter limnophilus]|uniref:DUF4293 family protein n=1 Tax=Mucilaginibacter limnophilus TaxID=1932778 RepID=A0A437MV93_9SPHI|nr:hypothetical protein [Mucilaginibacter limnophilus]RVU01585.1 hypothetical protein EOD41_06360 [Mucilaginibacter limnophilus]
MLKTLRSFFIFTVCLALPAVLLSYTGNDKYVLPQFWGIFILLGALTLGLVVAIGLVQKRHPELYAQTFLIMTIVKMLMAMLLALLIVLKTDVDRPVFMLNFFYIYFLNTGFEVYVLLRNLRNQN